MEDFPAYKILPIASLVPYARNSRTHSENQIAKIAASIREFRFLSPIIVDGDGGIVAGHGRVLAAARLGMQRLPCIEAEHLTDAQRRAYVLADNRIALDAEWNAELLRLEIGELEGLGFDLELTGFSLDEIAALEPEEIAGLTDPESTPEVPETPVTAPGDVGRLGRHRLMCGDSTNVADVDRLMDGEAWDVCVFDPPYEVESLYSEAMPPFEPGRKLLVMWDFKRFALAAHSALLAGWPAQYEFIWDCVQSWYTPNRPLQRHKSCGVFGDDPFFDTEKAIIRDGKDRGRKRTVRNTRGETEYTPLKGAKHIASVEAFPNTAQNDGHGHGKPVAWIEAIFNGVGGRTYLDLFGGSGASLIACEKTGKDVRMMELSPNFCDAIILRWQDFTGGEAVLEGAGVSFADMKKGVTLHA